MADYQRIHQVIRTVLDGADAHTERACIFFCIVGAFLLKEIYKKNAVPIAGAAFYFLDDKSGLTAAFASMNNNEIASSNKAFHCWIQCEGYIVDFMAPIFRESLKTSGHDNAVARKMFQKKLVNMAPSPNEMSMAGDFYHLPDIQLTQDMLQSFMQKNSNKDLLKVCMTWYKKPPKPIPQVLGLQSDDGKSVNMNLCKVELTGAW